MLEGFYVQRNKNIITTDQPVFITGEITAI